jgi:hypothetical protein
MPVISSITGVWKVGYDWYWNTGIVCKSLSRNFEIDMNNVSDLMCGGGSTLVKKIDNVNTSFSLSGPMLFTTTVSDPPNNPCFLDYVAGPSYPFYDAYWYTLRLMGAFWLNMSRTAPSASIAINSVNLTIDQDGLNIETNWYSDPINLDVGDLGPYDVGGEIGGLRESKWYDFYASLNGFPISIVSANASINMEYENLNIIGGLAKYFAQDPRTFLGENWSHTPFRGLKGISLKIDIKGLIPIQSWLGLWGVADFFDYSERAFYNSVQKEDVGYYDLESFDIYTVFPGSNPLPLIRTLLKGSTSLSNIVLPENDGATNFIDIRGWYVNSVKQSINPGVCEVDMSIDAIMPLKVV